ncbi:MAG TPA: tetratricopeptide repeat-containing protein [Pyrinomonadaceae bacterium]|jgi:hypothetical protein
MNDSNQTAATEAEVLKLTDSLKGAASLPALVALWQARDPDVWLRDPAPFRALGKRALKLAAPVFAYDVVSEGLRLWPADVGLRQLQALALSRSGAQRRATALLTRLVADGHSDEETLGMLARTLKDCWLQATDDAERARQLRLARDAYLRAYESSGGYWTAINAATLSLFMAEPERAHDLAAQVRAACLRELNDGQHAYGERYWPLATLGEAALILGDLKEAEARYCEAVASGSSYGEIASTRRNARLLLAHLQLDGAGVERCLRLPRVVVCSGHLLDAPGRAHPRFPAHLEAAVRERLRARLKELDAGIGYSSAACGSDILFLETMAELGGETNVVLPYNREQFVAESVEVLPGAGWRARFEAALERAATVTVASEQKIGEGGLSYEYCNLLLQGVGLMRAEQLDTGLVPLAVWDGRAGDGPGGTAAFVAQWQATEREVEVIDTAALLAEVPAATADESAPRADARTAAQVDATNGAAAVTSAAAGAQSSGAPAAGALTPSGALVEFVPQIKALLFADAVHFSKLTEEQIPLFLRHFLEPVGRLLDRPEYAPEFRNTWGDGLYFVFDSVRRAGLFALELCDQLNRTDRTAQGLPAELNLRVALHAGPVFACTDPILLRPTFFGTHVSRAARIEPITPPGQVYASLGFAALTYAQAVRAFTCEYVGQTPLAKGYGTFQTYLVRRR